MEVHYTMEVEQFPSLTKPVLSPVFSGILGGRLTEWYLQLYPNSKDGRISVFLFLVSSIPAFKVLVRFSCINVLNVMAKDSKWLMGFTYNENKGWGCANFMKRESIFKRGCQLLSHGHILRIHCCITSEAQLTHCRNFNAVPTDNPYAGLWKLYKQQELVDVTIKADRQEFKVHKNLLVARSDVFAAMFHHSMKENSTNTIVIEDFQPRVVQEMIRFIYLDVVDHLDELAVDLLNCAEKYNLKKLKFYCARWFMATLSTENAVETLLMARACNVPDLKARAITYIAENLKKVIEKESWKKVLDHVDIMQELFVKVALKN